MILVVALLPFTMPGEPLVSIFGYAASSEGLWRAAQITLRSNAVVLMTLALLGLTDLVYGHALEKLRVPAKLVQLLLMTVRYIDVLGREYRRLRVAMTVRGFRMRCNVHTWRAMGYLFGMLFVRSLERAERISAAMRCRGFRGRFPTLSDMALARRDAVFAVIAVLAALAVGSLELAGFHERAADLPPAFGELRLRANRPVLKRADLILRRGERLALVGPNGWERRRFFI